MGRVFCFRCANCETAFEVNVHAGAICPECGAEDVYRDYRAEAAILAAGNLRREREASLGGEGYLRDQAHEETKDLCKDASD